MSDVSYVRTEMLPEQLPPNSAPGPVKWMQENLFSGVLNSILTILSVVFLWYVLSGILPWVWNGVWKTGSLAECREAFAVTLGEGSHGAACWSVIRERFLQLMYGFYPSEFYWRPNLSFVLLLIALAPILFSSVPRKMLWFSVLYPFFMPTLLWGGTIWVPILMIAGFAVAYGVYTVAYKQLGNLLSMLSGTVVLIVWMLFAITGLTQMFNAAVTGMVSSGARADLVIDAENLPVEIASLEARQAELTRQIEQSVEQKDALLEAALAEGASKAEKSAFMDMFPEVLLPLRSEASQISGDLRKRKDQLTAAVSSIAAIDRLPEEKASLGDLNATAAMLRADLPDSVSDFSSLQDVDTSVPKADVEALEAAILAETKARTTANSISSTESQIGLIGLTPVESSLFGGFMLALVIGVTGIILSLPLGILLALGRQSDLLIVKSICVGFIEFIRGVPLITLLFVASTLLNYFLPPGTTFDIILRVIIMVTLFAAAYMAEVIRGGLAALPTGQYEAADALGLDYWKATRLIIMPQALKISIPGIVSTFIGLFKDTVLVSIIALADPLGLTNNIRADANWNGIVWELYGFIALVFFIFCFSMSRYSMYLERKLKTGH
ncbi:MAG: ABC transporter permease subunit [Amylibacter sp.]